MITNKDDLQALLGPYDFVIQMSLNPNRGIVRFCPNEQNMKTHRYCGCIRLNFLEATCTIIDAPAVFPNTECSILEACDIYTRMAKFIRESGFTPVY